MAIDATAGGANADSYVDVADADAYHTTRLHNSEWTAATTADKEAALKWATRLLEPLQWQGYAAGDTQALRWPRTGVYDLDGNELDGATIPAFLEEATAELAWRLIIEDTTISTDLTDPVQLSLDGVGSITYRDKNGKPTVNRSVNRLVSPYLINGSASGTGFAVVRV